MMRPPPISIRTYPRFSSTTSCLSGASALFFFCIGGLQALLIRAQLAAPGQKLFSADLYNQIFTMHGVTMIFVVVMPLGAAFRNYLIPIQIGARDVAFPRPNALSLWTFLLAGTFAGKMVVLGTRVVVRMSPG